MGAFVALAFVALALAVLEGLMSPDLVHKLAKMLS